MAALRIATKANQATSIPALLVVTYANRENPNAAIDIKYDEVETLKSGIDISTEFVVEKDASSSGFQEVLNSLTTIYPVLYGKYETPVGYRIL